MSTPTVPVTVTLAAQDGTPYEGVIVRARLDGNEVYEGIVISDQVEETTDADGVAILNLFPNAPSPTGLGTQGTTYRFFASIPGGRSLNVDARVPNSACRLENILVTDDVGALSAAELAVLQAQTAVTTAASSAAAAEEDAIQTAADRVQTGLDRVATGEDRAVVEAVAANYGDISQAVVDAQAGASAASASATLAQDWATKTDGEVVTGQGYGAKKYKEDAETAKAGAETAQVAAENARDATLAAGAIYPDTTAGLAATASGGYFYVPSTIAGESLILYKDNAGVAEEVKRYPSADAVTDIQNAIQNSQVIGRPVASPPVTGSALSANTYVIATPVTYDGKIESIRLYGVGSTTLKVRVFDKSGNDFTRSGSDTNVSVSAGLQTIAVDIDVLAGQYIGFYAPANCLNFNAATADSGGWYSAGGTDVTTFTDSSVSTATRLEIGFDLTYIAPTATRMEAAEADIVALQTTQAEHTDQLDSLPVGNQIIGRPVDPITGSATSLGTYVFADPVVCDGIVRTVRAYGLGTTTAKMKRFTRKNDTFTQVGSDVSLSLVAGLNTITVDEPVNKGEYLAFYTTTTGVPRVVTAADSHGYYSTGSDSAGFSSTTRNTSNQFQIGFDIEFNDGQAHVVDLDSASRIVGLGDSHLEEDYCIRGKGILSKLSLFTDWNVENFGKSGDKASDILTRLRAGTLTFGSLSYQRRGITYALIYVGQNDAAAVSLSTFLENMRQLIETVRGLGAVPVISTQHTDTYGVGSQAIFRNLCERYGALFVDVTPNCRIMDYGTRYAGFWGGTHHATRTNEEIASPLESFLRSLGQPAQSLKVFRKRDSVTVSTVADLMFDTHYDRARLFREILVGQGALKVADEAYCDEANAINTATQTEIVNSEYMTLQNGGTIALGDYSLIEVAMPVCSRHIDMLTLVLSETGATVYARDILSTLTTNLPVGAWKQIAGANGRYSLSKNELRSAMRFDKVSFLVYKSGGIAAFEQPRVEWFGEPIPKPALPVKTEGKTWAKGSELLAATDLGSTTGWTVTGSLTAGAPTDGCLPRGSTGRVTVDASNYLSQAFTYSQSTTEDREVEVRVRCRYFPAIVSHLSPGSAQITQDSFDYRRVQIDVQTAAGRSVYLERVGLWWKDVVLRTTASMLTTSMTLHVLGPDGGVEVAYASVKFVDA